MPALLSWIILKRSASNGNKSGRRVRSILHIACRTLWKRIQSGRGPSFLAFHPGKFNFNCFGLDLGRVAELCKSQSSGQFSAVGQCASASGAIGWKYSNHFAALPVGETAIDSNWLPKIRKWPLRVDREPTLWYLTAGGPTWPGDSLSDQHPRGTRTHQTFQCKWTTVTSGGQYVARL